MSADSGAGETERVPLEAWPEELRRACQGSRHFREIRVVRETPSTQDVARAMGVGGVAMAWRQTAGRGRLGRAWQDTLEDGLAISVCVPAEVGALASVAAGIAAAIAIEGAIVAACPPAPTVALKWPNDLLIQGRKVGGILVEGDGKLLTIGIGINCSQRQFTGELTNRATSLALHGASVDRLEIAVRLLPELDRWLHTEARTIADEFSRRDALVGTELSFSTASGIVSGIVRGVDVVEGIRVETHDGVITLDPRTSCIVAKLS